MEQLVDVAALGSSMKRNAMWHVPHREKKKKKIAKTLN